LVLIAINLTVSFSYGRKPSTLNKQSHWDRFGNNVFLLLSIAVRQDQDFRNKIVLSLGFLTMLFLSVYENLLTSDLTLDPPELRPGTIYDFVDQGYYVFFQREIAYARVYEHMLFDKNKYQNSSENLIYEKLWRFKDFNTIQNLGLAYVILPNVSQVRQFVLSKNKMSYEIVTLEEHFGNERNLKRWKIKIKTKSARMSKRTAYSQSLHGYYPVAFRVRVY